MERLRLPIAFVLAWGVTVGLFWSLNGLIAGGGEFEVMQLTQKLEFVRLRRDSQIEGKKRQKPEIEKPPPPTSEPSVATESASNQPGFEAAALAPSLNFSGTGASGIAGGGNFAVGGGTDRECMPQVRIQPDYPMQARAKRIEGWVDIQFTVGPDGSVKNAVILGSQPADVFDRPALQALSNWKYNPKVKDGQPVDCQPQPVRIAFQLEE